MNRLAVATTALFVPGDRPERFAKAAASGADVIIIDLEDAVAADRKALAREHVAQFFASGGNAAVRINASSSDAAAADIAWVDAVHRSPGLVAIMIAKAETPADVARVHGFGVPIVPLVESARSVRDVDTLAQAPGVCRLALGAQDLSSDLGCDPGSPTVAHAGARLVIASRAADLVAPLDSPSTQIADLEAVSGEARVARKTGFGGKLCIHPAQLEAVRAAFVPTSEELDWARAVMQAGEGAARVRGEMVDPPVIARAERILLMAERSA